VRNRRYRAPNPGARACCRPRARAGCRFEQLGRRRRQHPRRRAARSPPDRARARPAPGGHSATAITGDRAAERCRPSPAGGQAALRRNAAHRAGPPLRRCGGSQQRRRAPAPPRGTSSSFARGRAEAARHIVAVAASSPIPAGLDGEARLRWGRRRVAHERRGRGSRISAPLSQDLERRASRSRRRRPAQRAPKRHGLAGRPSMPHSLRQMIDLAVSDSARSESAGRDRDRRCAADASRAASGSRTPAADQCAELGEVAAAAHLRAIRGRGRSPPGLSPSQARAVSANAGQRCSYPLVAAQARRATRSGRWPCGGGFRARAAQLQPGAAMIPRALVPAARGDLSTAPRQSGRPVASEQLVQRAELTQPGGATITAASRAGRMLSRRRSSCSSGDRLAARGRQPCSGPLDGARYRRFRTWRRTRRGRAARARQSLADRVRPGVAGAFPPRPRGGARSMQCSPGARRSGRRVGLPARAADPPRWRRADAWSTAGSRPCSARRRRRIPPRSPRRRRTARRRRSRAIWRRPPRREPARRGYARSLPRRSAWCGKPQAPGRSPGRALLGALDPVLRRADR